LFQVNLLEKKEAAIARAMERDDDVADDLKQN
jgi:hypothetical protein